MQWWNDFVTWLSSDDGWHVISTVVIPFVAIVVAGFIAAGIGRGSAKRLLALNDRELRAAAVTAMIGSARRAAVWNTLSDSEQRHADHSALESDIRLRLLAVTGASLASDWCAHEIAMMKKNAVSFSFQAEQSLLEFKNRLIEWHARPSRAKKLFKNDLDSWAYDSSLADQDLLAQQKAWAAQQAAGSASTAASSSSAAPSSPAVRPRATRPFSRRAESAPAMAEPSVAENTASENTASENTDAKGSTAESTLTPASFAPTPQAAAKAAPELRESTDSDEPSFPPPVSVSQVSKRINPPQLESDELR